MDHINFFLAYLPNEKKCFISSSLLALLFVGLVAMYVKCSYVPEFNGIDISHHNRMDWKKIKADEAIKFCYIKATEGNPFATPCVGSMQSGHGRMDCL